MVHTNVWGFYDWRFMLWSFGLLHHLVLVVPTVAEEQQLQVSLFTTAFCVSIQTCCMYAHVHGASVNRAILKTSWTVNAFIYLVLTHMNTIVYIKEFRFIQFQFNTFNNLTHWKQKSCFPKITSFRWPPFHSRHSVSLLWTSPITLWSISTGILVTSCWIQCFNSWTV
jgi:hypothetical protein